MLVDLCARQFASQKGIALLWELEIVVSLTCDRLARQHEPHYPEGHGSGFFWELASSERRHSESLAVLAGFDKGRTKRRVAATKPYGLGWAGLASWRYLIGPPLHQLSLCDCKKAIAALEHAQCLFYLALATHCQGHIRKTIGAIAAEEMEHSRQAGLMTSKHQQKLPWAIVLLLVWDLPRIRLGMWQKYGSCWR